MVLYMEVHQLDVIEKLRMHFTVHVHVHAYKAGKAEIQEMKCNLKVPFSWHKAKRPLPLVHVFAVNVLFLNGMIIFVNK